MHSGNMTPTAAQLEEVRRELGLNDPLPVQFLRWAGQVIRFDLGRTLWTKQPVARELLDRLPATLALAGTALAFAIAISLPLGIVSAARPGSRLDALARIFAISGISLPQFWLGLLLMYVVSYKLQLLPMMGSGGPRHLVLPALTLAMGPAAMLTRMVRANMLEVMTQEYARTAYAKGLSEPACSSSTSCARRSSRWSPWWGSSSGSCSAAPWSSRPSSPGRGSASGRWKASSTATCRWCAPSSC